MNENILDLLYELKKKCVISDDAFMLKADLTQAEYHFFIAISSCDEINSALIAKKMDLSLSRVSRVLDKLVKRKFLIRKTNSNDRRAIKLKLTKEGEELKKQIEEYRKDCEYKITNSLSGKELADIKKSFYRVLDLL